MKVKNSRILPPMEKSISVTSGLVLITTLQTYIATNQKLGGDQFKVNFVVLVVSLMMKNNQRSYVNHHVLKSLMDVNDIANYNWCEYILDSLRNAKLNWAVKKNYFEGPLLFLMLFYVDRVVHKKRTVDRDFFTLTGWTTTALYARQKEEMKSFHFGEGTIEDMMVENVNTQSGSVSPNTQPGCQTTIKDYIHELAFKTKATAEHLMSLESLIKDRPPKLYENPDMKKLCNVAMKLMNEPYDEGGCSQNVEVNDLAVTNADPDNPEHEIGSSSPTKVTSNATLDDEFYASDEVLLAIQAN
ncbi:uncharacterized protein LOC141621674 [Silene latifolia]|uniref:uncharacterized protein LOC141621674 n=1 Tax=Silene latifolia TaxID=37657 RepID=UPI003D773EDC